MNYLSASYSVCLGLSFEEFQCDEIVKKNTILSLDNFVLKDYVLFAVYFYLSLCLQCAMNL